MAFYLQLFFACVGSYYQANCPAECTSSWDHDINVFAGEFIYSDLEA